MKKILIISYIFPPTDGIGGRRWAKFAKYLYRKGYDVKVITAKVPYVHKSNWDTDIKELANEDRITYIESGYPKYIYNPETVFEKIMYRISLIYLKLTVEGQYYDKSVLWEKHLIPVVEAHITNGYKTIIATGAPFRYLTFLGKLKLKYNDIKLIADIRDPWINNKTSYGYDNLSKKRFEFEKESEKYLVKTFDTLITVNDMETLYFSNLNNKTKCEFRTIRNGFDYDDIRLPSGYKRIQTDKLVFVYIGTLYENAMQSLNEFIEALKKLKENEKDLYERLEFNFYGSVPHNFIEIIKNYKVIKFHGKIPLNEVAIKIFNSHATMIFLPTNCSHYFVTKFYEYISLKRPLLVFSEQGITGEFVEKNKLGFMIPQGDMYKKLLYAIDQISEDYQVNESFDLSQYNVEYLTDELIDVLDNQKKEKHL